MQTDTHKNPRLLPDDQANHFSRRRTLISFATLTAAALAGAGSWRWLMSRSEEDGIPWPIRRVLRLNEKVSESIFRNSSRIDQHSPSEIPTATRLNSSIGVDPTADSQTYRLKIIGTRQGDVSLTLADLMAMPPTQQTTRLCCIEGWNTWGNWVGVKFADLAAKYPPRMPVPYVGMATANNAYYVGLDYASAIHPQTLLAYRLNSQPLSPNHGYPLRLVIPTKYGIKNIKQVATLTYTQNRPTDYWAEQGYDWYSGL